MRDIQKKLSFTSVTRAKTSLSVYHLAPLPGYFEQGRDKVSPPRAPPRSATYFEEEEVMFVHVTRRTQFGEILAEPRPSLHPRLMTNLVDLPPIEPLSIAAIWPRDPLIAGASDRSPHSGRTGA